MGTKDSFRLVILSVVVLSFVAIGEAQSEPQGLKPVSYTHLTLPTN